MARQLLPKVPQVAVFDTSFHHTMPEHAYIYAVPYELYKENRVRRYGFHGTSHRYVAARAAAMLGKPLAEVEPHHLPPRQRLLDDRHPARRVDRHHHGPDAARGPGDGHALGRHRPGAHRLPGAGQEDVGRRRSTTCSTRRAGCSGCPGSSNDVRSVLKAEAEGNARAKLALDIYCYRIKKYIGAYTAALGSVHALVFTAGVGENSAVDPAPRPRGHGAARLHARSGQERAGGRQGDGHRHRRARRIRILAVPTNEELLIAQDTYEVAAKGRCG